MTYSIKFLIENLLSELGKNDIQYKGKISKFLVDNNWFNIEIDLDNYSISDNRCSIINRKNNQLSYWANWFSRNSTYI